MVMKIRYYNYVKRVCNWVSGSTYKYDLIVDRWPMNKSDLLSVLSNAQFVDEIGYERDRKRELLQKVSKGKVILCNPKTIELYFHDAGEDIITITNKE